MNRAGWTRLVVVVAAIQIGLGLAGVVFGDVLSSAKSIPVFNNLLQTVIYGAVGVYLLLGARSDARAASLGTAFLLVSVSFSTNYIEHLEDVLPSQLHFPIRFASDVRTDAFLPVFLWLFVRDFPRDLPTYRTKATVRRIMHLCIAASLFLIAVNAILVTRSLLNLPVALSLLEVFSSLDPSSHYWTVVYGLMLPALILMIWKSRRCPLEERKRVGIFITGLSIGAVPAALFILLFTVFPGFYPLLHNADLYDSIMVVLWILIASVPFTTAYSVVVDRVLDVRLIIRKALQYGLARALLTALTIVPFVWLVWYLHGLRGETLAAVLSGQRLLYVSTAVLIGVGFLIIGKRAIDFVDGLFFRERYDSRQIISNLIERSRQVNNVSQVVHVLTLELDRAFHLESVGVLAADGNGAVLQPVSSAVRGLDASSELAYYLTVVAKPVSVDLDKTDSVLRDLSEEERQWLVDSKFQLIAPFISSDGSLLGLVGLGEKRSELPFSKGDEELLSAMAASGSVTLETLRRRGLDAFEMPQHEALARECPKCFQMANPTEATCTNCALPTNLSSVPRNLAGKFLFEKRIGSGAMGVVYQATDLTLGRTVAIKTLPQTSPEGAAHLRREARAMAKIVHPNLALIFGAETWKGLPLLVFEFLKAGTLADRLETATVPILETIAIGVAMSSVLHKTHSTGLLHGDVKPSNIGFNSDGVPKLLDFGLARLFGNGSATLPGNLDGEDPTRIKKATFLATGLAGTPLFMPPEVLSGEPPDPSSDLWALTLVMYEALTRRNPFQKKTWAESKKAILEGSPPDVREIRPECPAPLAGFIDSELSKSRVRRSATARDFQRRLAEVEAAL